jgi:hypothetical protein
MAPELIPPVDIDHEEAYEEDGSLKNPQPPCCTKATDVFAFSMVALQASNPLLEILLTSGSSAGLFAMTSLFSNYYSISWSSASDNFVQTLTGALPFFYVRQGSTAISQIQNGQRPDRSRCLPTIIADPMWELLVNCWDQDPMRRPYMQAAVQCLENM